LDCFIATVAAVMAVATTFCAILQGMNQVE
jgi:hypothetical protein